MKTKTTLATQNPAALWQGFKPRVGEINHRQDNNFYSIQVYTGILEPQAIGPDLTFEKWAAVAVGPEAVAPEGMEILTIAAGTWAVFLHHGPAAAFQQTAIGIYGIWLPGSGYALDDRPHYEVMAPDYAGPAHPEAEEEVWIPVKTK